MNLDLAHVARDLGLPLDRIQRTVQMLDEGNTVPFITRYRKDQTGGLDEEAIRAIQDRVAKLRLVVERKQTILKSIEAQGKLTPELAHQINTADSIKRLEDLYLPFKPKKQTLATKAREQGLEPLALEILNADPAAADRQARASELINPEKGLSTVDDVLQGVGYLIAEKFSERADIRGRLRRMLWRTGRLVSARIEPSEKAEAAPTPGPEEAGANAAPAESPADASATAPPATSEQHDVAPRAEDLAGAPETATPAIGTLSDTHLSPESAPEQQPTQSSNLGTPGEAFPAETSEPTSASTEAAPETIAAESSPESVAAANGETPAAADSTPAEAAAPAGAEEGTSPAAAVTQTSVRSQKKKKKKKKKETASVDAAFKDYFQYQEPLSHIPPHRVLAINRGERAKVLRVRIDADINAMYREVEPILVPPEHPHADFLRDCLRDALDRLIVPSLEREARREMTEKAEHHAVDVFIRNLRKLLLQPPIHGRRVLAVDPGFKSGCKLAALDEFGNVLGHAIIHVVGNEERRRKGREQMVDMIRSLDLSVVAIGNGTACREAEQLVADIIATELADRDVQYTVVNEAGASVYSTSPIGREEFPGYDPLLRSAISIGRRLLDPLSELVKINPANIGVGLYQHDVKAKHLRDSLDGVVESAVNYVGVDVNTASPALLRYVSGLNQLTARRLYEYRTEHGPFRSREQFHEVPGFGDATFVQAAGFLKIFGGDNPLDATWIHPESYDIARKVLERLNSDMSELAVAVPPAPQPKKQAPLAKVVQQVSATSGTDGSNGAGAPAIESPSGEASLAPSADAPAEATAESASSDVSPEASLTPPTAEPTSPDESPAAATDTPVAEEKPTETPAEEPAADASAAPEAPVAPEAAAAPEAPPRKGPTLAERAAQADPAALAQELGVGELLLRDILASLMRPGRDPREDLPPPIFRRGIMKLEDLQPGMELQGTVLNVVDFGAFVDIGLSDSGLVHISRLADRYVRDPHEVVGVGDVLKVWVVDVDKQRRRVSLTAIQPGTERPPQLKRERPPRGAKKAPRKPQPAAQGTAPAGAAPASGDRRPSRRPPRPAQAGGQAAEGSTATVQPARPARPFNPKDARGPAPTVGSKKMLSKQLKAKKKVKPNAGLTKAMEEGREPMRSFSDLLQFVKKREPDDEKK